MENSIKPDKIYFKKCILILSVITGLLFFIVICLSVLNLIISSPELYATLPLIYLIWIISVVLMWAISVPIIKLWIKNLEYVIRNDRITIHKGILTKTQQNIPYRSVTDFALQRTLFDRYLGIGSINIQTAGQSQSPTGYEGSLVGLINYDALHGRLKEKLKMLHPISEATTVAEPIISSNENVLNEILSELKQIHQKLSKK
ncbi:MAG: PH domain-containing protein [Candidatus Marinimicrobia bacterium]|jgi:uncharacterized membrane protein YdbT with pleckstrin-like domain|nr:PH domain-containing protein [Candidatus Neomarinimicrobiota bacterium]MBT3634808.1 PH domain-containing protein [Candidatus Neomarinimicrobiota bacterium]MBT3683578.1 PH domain-containing protein [Candidatus Neomarinimicrobiota bacterium]MBT3760461.1 PH domain-containing protein [Candidatus Neomarinimicrobiota bacterium]MBT3896607.1 PH domain-containing protein [Candidatus Neomarinimicrobiota bacterium]